MLVLDDGNFVGGISGGCLDGDALIRARKAIYLNKPSVITYDTTQDDQHQIGVGLGCNGIIDVMFTPLHPQDAHNPIHVLSSVAGTRTPRVVVTITGDSENRNVLGSVFLYEDNKQFASLFPLPHMLPFVLDNISECLAQQASKTINWNEAGEEVQVFIEVVFPALNLVIYGGNYDIYPVVRIAHELGWNTMVVMNKLKAGKALFELGVQVVHNKSGEQPAVDDYTAILLMAHDYDTDLKNLRQVLQTNAGYIGLLGPRKRSQKIFDALAHEGRALSEHDQQRIFAPAGLDIGAVSPEEIAVSIIAEVRACFAGREGSPLRFRKGAIHDR